MMPRTRGATELAYSQIAATILGQAAPYADAWKKFDRLKQWAKHGWEYEYVMFAIVVLTGLVGAFEPKLSYLLMIVEIAFGVVLALIAQRARWRFKHWPCPQCHAEWPGKKLEKEPCCAMCGLKLHQMAP